MFELLRNDIHFIFITYSLGGNLFLCANTVILLYTRPFSFTTKCRVRQETIRIKMIDLFYLGSELYNIIFTSFIC